MASIGSRRWYPLVVLGYVLAFGLLSGALSLGMPLGVAYGIWTAVGILATAALSRLLFREPLTPLMLGGMGLIVVGVMLVELGGTH
jgi:small multidrug resistance pump